jgi:WD40 repeat protein/Holliday junction resolvase-like predicted endonuclease
MKTTKKKKSANDLSERGRQAYKSGHEFEKQVSELLTLQGYKVELNVEREGTERDIIARLGGDTFFAKKKGDVRVVVQCKKLKERVSNSEIKKFIEDIRYWRGNDECDRGLMVSDLGFVKTTCELRTKWNFVEFKTYNELLAEAIDFNSYLRKLVADFDEAPENAPNEPPLSAYYIPIKAEIKSFKKVPGQNFEDITDFVKPWLKRTDPKELHPVILGTYGTGKTTVCRKLARDLAKEFLEANNKAGLRIPILFDLRHFTNKVEIEALVTRHLDKACGVGVRYDLFAQMNKAGLFLLIFDGFDEMETKVTWDIIQKNLIEINKLAAHPRSKVLITSRPEHFISEEEESNSLEHCNDPLVIQHRQFQRINLLPLNSKQVENFLQKRVPFIKEAKKNWTYYRDKIKEIHDLTDLSKRPVLLEMIVRTLPGLVKQHEEEGIEINRPNLYQRYLSRELDRQIIDKQRELLLDRSTRFNMMEKLAIRFFIGEKTSITFDEAVTLISETIKPPRMDLEAYTRDFLTCSFLIRVGDEYRFSHNSFWEYLSANSFSKEIDEYSEHDLSSLKSFGKGLINPVIRDFLIEMNLSEDKLWMIILETRNNLSNELKYIGSNACTLLNYLRADFKNKDLSKSFLEGADLCRGNFEATNFSGAILKNANLTDATLKNANFSNVNLEGFIFEEFNNVYSVDWSPDGNHIASGSQDTLIMIWDAKTYNEVVVLRDHSEPVNSLVWSPDGKYIVSGSDRLVIHSTDKWRKIFDIIRNTTVYNRIAVSSNGKYIACEGEEGIETIWNMTNRNVFKTFEVGDTIRCSCFSKNDELLIGAIWYKHMIYIWNIKNKNKEILIGHSHALEYVEYSTQGDFLISGSIDGIIKIWDVKKRQNIQTLKLENKVLYLFNSPYAQTPI